jgi:hypothetical protein
MVDTRRQAVATASINGRPYAPGHGVHGHKRSPFGGCGGRSKALLGTVALLVVAGCSANNLPAIGNASTDTLVANSVQASSDTSASSQSDMAVALRALEAFANTQTPSWSDFSRINGIAWNAPEPQPTPDTMDSPELKEHHGRFDWRFDVAPERSTDRAVGISIVGKKSIELMTFRRYGPSTDYVTAIRSQLGAQAEVARIASGCTREMIGKGQNRGENAFFSIRLAGSSTPVYMEASVERDGGNKGPGSTTYTFTHAEPRQRIETMACART